jgi:hypothetical protein
MVVVVVVVVVVDYTHDLWKERLKECKDKRMKV